MLLLLLLKDLFDQPQNRFPMLSLLYALIRVLRRSYSHIAFLRASTAVPDKEDLSVLISCRRLSSGLSSLTPQNH